MTIPDHYQSVFFVLGLFIVAAYAWQRFNEPSFPNNDTLPRMLDPKSDPLPYLFLRRAYRKARFTYIAASLLLYSTLVWPGPTIVPALGIVGVKDFPAEGWALLVALLLVGLIPNSNVKWLTMIEDRLRGGVHAWFLVPDRIVQTIGLLEDARYEPPQSQINAVASPQRERLQKDLKAPTNTLRYRWARATMLMASLNQMGAGASHPLRRAAFVPFREDFQVIRDKHQLLAQEIAALSDEGGNPAGEEAMIGKVDHLLKRIYSYISWGLRQQADTEQDVDSILEELGFTIPAIGERRLFDVVMPAVLLVAVIAMGFWLTSDLMTVFLTGSGPPLATSVVGSVSSAMAASLMYGGAVLIALKLRASQIERKEWRRGSARCLVPIAIAAGLLTWAVIIVTTALWEGTDTLNSLASLALLAKALATGTAADPTSVAAWKYLPIKILTAAPWLLAGVTVSVLTARLVGAPIARQAGRRRLDALVMGGGLGLAAGTAQLIQLSLLAVLSGGSPSFGLVPLVGVAGALCGITIGLVVPHAFRTSFREPFDPISARSLSELLRRAEDATGSRSFGESWAFTPNPHLHGITPAEAIQFKAYASTVRGLLDRDAVPGRAEPPPDLGKRPQPMVIEGGRMAG